MTPLQHLQLLLRFDRTFNLQRIICDQVSAGHNVLDAGCGLGILSQWAAQAGAKVTAVDLDDVSLAARLAAENGWEDRIAFHRANLFDLVRERPELKRSFDVIIAMVYLNDPRRDEQQTQLTVQLKNEFLRPGGKTIPTHVEYVAVLGEWAEQDYLTRQTRLDRDINSISQRYDLKFESLKTELLKTTWKDHFPARSPDGNLCRDGFRFLGSAERPIVVDYRTDQTAYPAKLAFTAEQAGVANVVLWTQRILFGELLIFSNESISWLEKSICLKPHQTASTALDERWRTHNLLSFH